MLNYFKLLIFSLFIKPTILTPRVKTQQATLGMVSQRYKELMRSSVFFVLLGLALLLTLIHLCQYSNIYIDPLLEDDDTSHPGELIRYIAVPVNASDVEISN